MTARTAMEEERQSGRVAEWQSGTGKLASVSQSQGDSRFSFFFPHPLVFGYPNCTTPALRSPIWFFPVFSTSRLTLLRDSPHR